MAFVERGVNPSGCIFCLFPAESGEEADRRNLVVARSAHSFVILNRFPYTSGHLLVVPRRHTADYASLPPEELADLAAMLQKWVGLVLASCRPDGLNVGMNLGRAGGAGIADHLHWHIVPRWLGDTNFMTTVGDARVVVEQLEDTWHRMRALTEESPASRPPPVP
jgi:ATP adenylyltransferase